MTTAVRLLPRALARFPRPSVGVQWRRRLTVAAALLAVLAAAYVVWFRDSSFVRVERVTVTGLATTPGAARVETELTAAAERMSTLHVDRGALERIVAEHPAIARIRVKADFPHSLSIAVVENIPVAVVAGDSGRVPVAADGTLLEGVEPSGALPEVRTTAAVPSEGRLRSGPALDRVVAAAAAPAPLRAKVRSVTIQPGKGLVAQFADGPAVWLGDLRRLEAKWDAAAAVLAERSSRGAAYVDVRAPERAVAGGLAVTAEPQEAAGDALADPPADGPAAAAPTTAAAPVDEPAAPAPAAPEPVQTAPSVPAPEPQP